MTEIEEKEETEEQKQMAFEQVAEKIVEELNRFSKDANMLQRDIGVTICQYAKDLKLKDQKILVKTIKKSEKLLLHPQTVYDCYRMVMKFEEMMDEEWEPEPNLSISHYFNLSKYKMSVEDYRRILMEASDKKLSVRAMQDEINSLRDEKYPQDNERKTLLKELYGYVKKMTNENIGVLIVRAKEINGNK